MIDIGVVEVFLPTLKTDILTFIKNRSDLMIKLNRGFRLGDKLGKSIELVEYIRKNRGDSKFLLRCIKCGKEAEKWGSQLYKGEWEVCEHDLD